MQCFGHLLFLKIEKHIKNNFDIIISVSLPFTSHLCAYILKKKLVLNGIWILEIHLH